MAKKGLSPLVSIFNKLTAYLDGNPDRVVDETAEDAESGKKWSDGVDALFRLGSNRGVMLYVAETACDKLLEDEVLSFEDLQFLEGEGYSEGFQRVRLNGERVKAFALDYTNLKRDAQREIRDDTQVLILNRQVRELETRVKRATEQNVVDEAVAELIRAAMPKVVASKPEKLQFLKPASGSNVGGVPSLFLSDWHWGEVVDPAQVEGLNEYNLEIANKRADRVFQQSSEILLTHLGGLTYDGIVVLLGGDMVTGNIHEELQRTNDLNIIPCCCDLADKLASGLLGLQERFGRVYVPCVVGNHGRLERKPSAKGKVEDNFDYLVYRMVAARVAHNPNIVVDIATSADMRFDIYDTRYLLTHGDQIKGGAGVGGIWPSMMKTDQRKRKRHQISGGGYDYMVCGHFHRYGTVDGIIVNGSLKSYDEWVYTMNFDYEPAIQALWLTHPDLGVSMHVPVYGDTPMKDERQTEAIFSRPKG